MIDLKNSTNMKNLSVFVKDEIIKHRLFDDGVLISCVEDSEKYAKEIGFGKKYNLIFESTKLKEQFFDILTMTRQDVTIVNCNCSTERFYEYDLSGFVIFDNIKKCKNSDVIEVVKNSNGILIC